MLFKQNTKRIKNCLLVGRGSQMTGVMRREGVVHIENTFGDIVTFVEFFVAFIKCHKEKPNRKKIIAHRSTGQVHKWTREGESSFILARRARMTPPPL